ncbi:hypothetical protein PAAG_01547 [Paracoccidioides lutzii Pb01]|uniref:NAD dependent epimerase/dehydratase n=1 Tax=Paracoccidioides lutzii (strain ATCC MYA-826 / Pb01) TaxID=502779 RepID=C1GSQ2_PARBA|nr:hypothetical protein PAAG_01547 [Paracoccidioides lutzii Pb01]EEH39085.1 hypothetical protein PAAG_01547 [Paracoccidioides lutzii Pb01]
MSRLIDKEQSKRQRPMKVIVAGLCRTGTMSMNMALRELGFKTCHLTEQMDDPKRYFTLWTEAMNCNFFNKGRPYGREEFDRLLGEYDACLDMPCCLFWNDLHQAYPDAKIILTNRSVDSWMTSMHKTIFPWIQRWHTQALKFLDFQTTRPIVIMMETSFKVLCNNDYGDKCRQAYIDHYEKVRKAIPKDQLLEYNFDDGWKPLCEFLNVRVPDGSFPKTNSADMFNANVEAEFWNTMNATVKSIGKYVIPVIAISAAAWRWVA